ncbi:MAG TPA: hypothetical protein VGL65_04160 [Gemmatimonadales bacterium]|jgi:hypothetical protein
MRIPILAGGLLAAALVAACTDTVPMPNGSVSLGIVNALTATGAQLKVDQAAITLPAIGQAVSVLVAPGAHHLQLNSSTGASLVDTNVSVSPGGHQTVVLTGPGAVSVATDTNTTNPGDGGGYKSIVGSVLMVNAAPGTGPFDVVVYQANSDSVYHFGGFSYGAGSQPPPAPYGYYIPFVPATYTFTIAAPGGTTALASTQLTLATDDKWTVMLTRSIEGDLVLQAVKQ